MENINLNEEIASLREQKTAQQARQPPQKAQLAETKTALKKLSQENEALRQKLKSQPDLEQELNAMRMENTSLNAIIADFTQNQPPQKKQLAETKTTLHKLTQAYEKLVDDRQIKESALEHDISVLRKENKRLNETVSLLENENKSMLQNRQPPQKKQLAETKTAFKELSQAYEQLVDEKEDLRMKLKTINAKATQPARQQNTQAIDAMETRLFDAKTSIGKLTKEKADLQERYANLEIVYNELDDEYQKIYKEVLKLRKS